MLLNMLQCTGQLPTAKNYQPQIVSSDKAEKSCFKVNKRTDSRPLVLQVLKATVCLRGRGLARGRSNEDTRKASISEFT